MVDIIRKIYNLIVFREKHESIAQEQLTHQRNHIEFAYLILHEISILLVAVVLALT